MKKYTLPSGAVIEAEMAGFEDSKKLTNAVIRTLRGKNVADIDVASFTKLSLNNKESVGLALDRIMALASDEEVESFIFKCGERSNYLSNGSEESRQKFNRAIFDNATIGLQVRGDMYHIFWYIVKENVGPFLTALFSELKAKLTTIVSVQK